MGAIFQNYYFTQGPCSHTLSINNPYSTQDALGNESAVPDCHNEHLFYIAE